MSMFDDQKMSEDETANLAPGSSCSPATPSANDKSSAKGFKCDLKNSCTWSRVKGIALSLCSSLAFSLMLLSIKLTPSIPPFQLSSMRMLIQGLLCIPYLLKVKINFKKELKDWKTVLKLCSRCLTGSFAFMAVFFATRSTHLGDASAIFFCSPIFVSLISCFCLKERCGPVHIVLMAITLTGGIMVAHPQFIFGDEYAVTATEAGGLGAAAIACFLSAITFVLVRCLRHVNFMVIIFCFSTWGFIQSLIGSAIFETLTLPQTTLEWIFSCLTGVFGFMGQMAMTKALQLEQAALVSVLRTIEVLFAFLLEWAVLGYAPIVWSAVGGTLVMVSVAGTSINKLFSKDHQTETPADGDTADLEGQHLEEITLDANKDGA